MHLPVPLPATERARRVGVAFGQHSLHDTATMASRSLTSHQLRRVARCRWPAFLPLSDCIRKRQCDSAQAVYTATDPASGSILLVALVSSPVRRTPPLYTTAERAGLRGSTP